jgi:hypothetical protein
MRLLKGRMGNEKDKEQGEQPFSPVCVFWVRGLLKGEGARVGAGATGAALFLICPLSVRKSRTRESLLTCYLECRIQSAM